MLVGRLARAPLRQQCFGVRPWPAAKPSSLSCRTGAAAVPVQTSNSGRGLILRTAACRQQCSLARTPLAQLLEKSSVRRPCFSTWTCSSSTAAPRRAAGLSARIKAQQRGNNAGRLNGTTIGCSAGGARRFSSFFPRGGGSSDSTIVYGVVGLNLAGTIAMYLYTTQGTGGPQVPLNFLVSTSTTLNMGRLHTLFTSNFSHSNLWNGAIFSYMMYTLGPSAIQHLGRQQFLALYLLGGAFSQRKKWTE